MRSFRCRPSGWKRSRQLSAGHFSPISIFRTARHSRLARLLFERDRDPAPEGAARAGRSSRDEPGAGACLICTHCRSLLPDEDFRQGDRPHQRSRAPDRHRPLDPRTTVTEGLARPLAAGARSAGTVQAACQLPAPAQVSAGKQQIRYVHARDGTRIAYAVSGSGPAIVRASHWMSHLDFDWESPVWGHWIDALSSGFTFVRYDGRLNGLSDTGLPGRFLRGLCRAISNAWWRQRASTASSCSAYRRAAPSRSSTQIGIPRRSPGLVLYGGYVRGWRARGNAARDRQARSDLRA